MGLAIAIVAGLSFTALASYVGERWGLLYLALMVISLIYGVGWIFDSGVLAG